MDMTCRIFVTATTLLFIWILYLIFGADARLTVHTPTDLSVREGDTVTLVCTYEPRTEPAFFGGISWQMGETVLASYVCPNACSRTNANNARYTMDVDSRFSGNLTISDITLEDDNVYKCGVTTAHGVSESRMRLVVNGPPDPPVITGIPDNLIENQQTSISCQANNGHPPPSFQWFIGNRNLSEDATLLVSTDINSRIDATSQLRYLPQREDNGLALQCNVIHDELSQPLKEMSNALTVNYCPTTVEVTVCPEVEAGSSEVMVCRSGASNPASNLVWTKGVDIISEPSALQTHFEESSDPLGTRTTLSYMRNFTKDDYKQSFTCCTSVSPSCDSTVCSEPCIPNVIYAPEMPVVSRNMPGPFVSEGTVDLEFTCRADGNPRPALTWVVVGNEGLMLDQLIQEDGSQLLRFREVRREHAAAYRCIANNNIPPMNSREVQLLVHFPPSIQNTGYNKTTANESKKASLTCVVIGNPSPQVSWQRLGNHSANLWDRILVVTTEVNSDYESVVKSTLSIMDVQPDVDHGNYMCTAESSAGTDEAVINLSGAYPPTTPRITISKPLGTLVEGTEDLEILCDPAGGWPRPELVWISPNNSSLLLDQVTLGNGSQLLIFSEVSRANAGMYRCVANNSAPLTSSADHQLVVEFPSTIRNKDDNTEYALEGESVTFICEAEGKPSPTITWQQLRNQSDELDNGVLVTQSEQRTVYRSRVTSTLIIAEVIPKMYNATFSCVANNSHGTDRKNFHLKKPDPDSQNKVAPALISVTSIVILMILIFVIIRWLLSRKNKQAREQSQSPRNKNMFIADPSSSSIQEDKPYAELSNTGMKTQEHDYMPLNNYETPMEMVDRSHPNKEDKPYAELSNTGMKTQEHDYMPLNTYETPMELADRSPRGVPDSTPGGGVTARTNLEHTYADAEERGSREDSRENYYINNTVLIPKFI